MREGLRDLRPVVARGLAPVESGVVRGLDVSDHAPIWVLLEPSPGPGEASPDRADANEPGKGVR